MAISEENAHLPLLLKLSVYKCVGQNYVTYEEDLFAMFSRDEQERIIKKFERQIAVSHIIKGKIKVDLNGSKSILKCKPKIKNANNQNV